MSAKLMMVDLDGTLVDTSKVNYLAYKRALNKYGFDLEYDFFAKYCNGRHYMDFLPNVTTTDRDTLDRIHSEKKANYRLYLQEAILNMLLVDVLRLAKQEYKIAVVTTASKQNTHDILNYFHLLDLFDLVMTREDVCNSKPDPEGYIKTMQYFGAKASDVIIFEDTEIGVEAARRAGCCCFKVSTVNNG